jgi:molecular chaperone GrpE
MPEPETDEPGSPVNQSGDEVEAGDDAQTLRARAAERDEYLDRLQRMMAEFQNYKNRVGREKADLRKFVTGEVLRTVLPAVDNLERAVDSAGSDDSPLVAGVRMVIEQFQRALDQLGVKPVETAGARFDPTQMEAVARVETPDAEDGSVLDVYEKGYRLDDYVVRPARVTVAAAPRPDS